MLLAEGLEILPSSQPWFLETFPRDQQEVWSLPMAPEACVALNQ